MFLLNHPSFLQEPLALTPSPADLALKRGVAQMQLPGARKAESCGSPKLTTIGLKPRVKYPL